MQLSIVIPAYNEGRRLPRMLRELHAFLKTEPLRSEIIVIEDGSRSSDQRLVADAIDDIGQNPAVQVSIKHLTLVKNQGKGAAIEKGFLEAQGIWVGFLDADGAISIASVKDLLRLLDSNPQVDAVIGSRVLMLGHSIDRKIFRHYIGRVFATLFNWLFRIPVYDTQCGFKFFRRSKILDLLPQISDRRWVWDTQLIVLAFRNGLKMREFTVDWREVSGSKVSMLRDPMRMYWALLKFHWRTRS